MKKTIRFKNNTVLLLITAIVVLCIGFIIVGCGKGPQLKTDDPDKGQYALDFSNCPGGVGSCTVSFSNATAAGVSVSIGATPITMEAWIKPKTSVTATVLKRMVARGASLQVIATSTPSSMIFPRFEIRRVPSVAGGSTSTAAYVVDGTALALNEWTHIAGILTNQDHSGVVTLGDHPACAGAAGDPWHLDIYQKGTITSCAATYGAAGDSTSAANAYAHEPTGTVAAMAFNGIVDELRLWNTERTVTDCMNSELGLSGTCSRISDNLVLYSRFNTGVGHFTSDWSGIFGAGANEYPNAADPGTFLKWNTGWTTDTPTLSTAD